VLPRIAGVDALEFHDNEQSFSELYERIEKTVEYLKSSKPEDFVGKEDIEVSMFNGKFKFTGYDFHG
jgi:hypothetical protein